MDFILKLVLKKGSIHTCTHLSNLISFKNRSIYTNLSNSNLMVIMLLSNYAVLISLSSYLHISNSLFFSPSLSGKTLIINYIITTVLSGTLDSNHSSSLAVDGVTLCPQNSNLVAVSNWSPVPWLMIQLDTMYYIEKVVFYAGDGVYGKL